MRGVSNDVKIDYVEWDGSEVCAQVDPDLFFDVPLTRSTADRYTREYLRKICGGCEKLFECREYAIKYEAHGFWGGMTEQERTLERRKRNISVIRPELYSNYLPRANEAV